MSSSASTRKQYKLTATVYDKRGRVLSTGNNSYTKTHPVQKRLAGEAGRAHSIFLHAEIHALLKVRDMSRAHRIYIERYDVHGNPKPADPCEICRIAIRRAGIKIIDHT